MRLGIDFGTTRTVVAAADGGRYPVASFQTDEGFVDYLPGFAGIEEGELVYGAKAERLGLQHQVRSVKAAISGRMPDAPVEQLGENNVSALSLTTEYLRYVRNMLLFHSNLRVKEGEPLQVMASVPAHASTRQRYLTLEAFHSAGFEVLGLLNEPTASAVEYVHHCLGQLSERSPKRYVIVYDLGGGTFDTAAVSLKERRFDLIGAEGLSQVGGDKFDEIIARHAAQAAGTTESELGVVVMSRLLNQARSAKEALSPGSKKLLLEAADTIGRDLVLELGPIFEECAPWIDKTLESMDILLDGLRQRGIDPDNARELGAVYLVGGSSLFPPVQKMLRKKFGRKIQTAPQPHASTAVGLAIAADVEAGIFVREAPTRHFGVWRELEGGLEKIFDPIIEKRHGIINDGPVCVERVYRPAHAVGRLRFVECTDLDPSHSPRGEVTPWESVLFPYDPSLQECDDLTQHLDRKNDLSGEEILERYEYTSTGLMRVHIENLTRGYAREYILGKPHTAA